MDDRDILGDNMVQRALLKERSDGRTYDCEEVQRVLSMNIPVAMILEMPCTYSNKGSSHILIYFPECSNVIIYDTLRKLNKCNIKKIADINHWNDEREIIKEYQYVISISPFLKPNVDGIYRYIIEMSHVGSNYLEIVVYYRNDYEKRKEEKLEIWYYDDMMWRCKKPVKLGTWKYSTFIHDKERILIWETEDGTEIEEGITIPHICGYHERKEDE